MFRGILYSETTKLQHYHSYIPGLRFLAGLFKWLGSEEGLRSVIDYVNFTNMTSQLLNYQPAKVDGKPDPFGGIPAVTDSGVRAFRDIGLQVFDTLRPGPMEYGYAAMIGSGSTL